MKRLVSPGHGSALFEFRLVLAGLGGLGCNMSFISCARTSSIDAIHLNGPSVAGVWNVIQLFAVALGAASLAACAQSSVVTQRSELPAVSRQASVEHYRKTSFVTNRRLAVRKKHTPFASDKNA